MSALHPLIDAFFQLPSIAVVGISSRKTTVANSVLTKLRHGTRTVYAVGRSTTQFDGAPCYPDIRSLPAPVQGVFIAAGPDGITAAAEGCITAGVQIVWLHNMNGTSLPASSPLSPVVERLRANGIAVIPGACPMMFVPDADLGHRCIKWFLSVSGNLR